MRIIIIIFMFLHLNSFAQKYSANNGEITFYSYAPIEDIKAENNKVSAIYDSETKELVFQLYIENFNFRKKLMQEHFNENYLESDLYPKSSFIGRVMSVNDSVAKVQGLLSIHGISNQIDEVGSFVKKDNTFILSSNFKVKLEDYDVMIPKIVMYKIAEEISIDVNITLIEN